MGQFQLSKGQLIPGRQAPLRIGRTQRSIAHDRKLRDFKSSSQAHNGSIRSLNNTLASKKTVTVRRWPRRSEKLPSSELEPTRWQQSYNVRLLQSDPLHARSRPYQLRASHAAQRVRQAWYLLKKSTRECRARKTCHSLVRLQMAITLECVGKALRVLHKSIRECAGHYGTSEFAPQLTIASSTVWREKLHEWPRSLPRSEIPIMAVVSGCASSMDGYVFPPSC
ncbi:hypothetical protein CPBF424_21600 [Xanthomonas euroxanthea]|uniref:Uncharacterized protein n=1 Tax=Xanthomonas euroxanthea TaxID=2259622 RepID=A0AA46C8A2_9XANT|nr:hypothetical protein CPBF424_21600 [Xanthomonas euroxanthea]